MLGFVNKEHFHPHREVKKPKGSEKQVSKEGDGEPSPKKARVEEPETTTVKKVYFPNLCFASSTPPHPTPPSSFSFPSELYKSILKKN